MVANSWSPRALSLERVFQYLKTCVQIDTRTLAVFRVFVGLLILADLVLRSRNFSFYYTDDGVVPRSLAMALGPDNAFSFFHLTTDPTLIALLFVLHGLIAIQLILGYKTRVAILFSFLFVVSLDNHNPLVTSYADTLFRLLLFWAIFLPLGERWSIDAVHRDREPRTSFAGIATACILLQMVVMYLINGLNKTHSEVWTSGNAAGKVMGIDEMTFLLGDFVRNFPTLLGYGGRLWFYMLLVSWLLILLPGRKRLPLVFLFMGGHASFALTVRIGAFAYVALAGLLLFIQTPVWEDAKRLLRYANVDLTRLDGVQERLVAFAQSVPDYRLNSERQTRLKSQAYTFFLTFIVITTLFTLPFVYLQDAGIMEDEIGHESDIDDVASMFRIDQPSWSIFVSPRTTDRYYVFPAETENGEQIDVFNDQPLTSERPYQQLQKQHDTYRQRFYMNSIRRATYGTGVSNEAPMLLAQHICEEWEAENGEALRSISMYEIREDITLETVDDPANRTVTERYLYTYGCGDNPSERIQLPPREYTPTD